MQVTSHFVGINLKSEVFSDIFVEVYQYIQNQNIENIVNLQNPLSPHITLYYLEKNLSTSDKTSIKKDIADFDITQPIFIKGFDYFFRDESRFVLYFTTSTDLQLKKYRDNLHESYNRKDVIDNSFDFSPHITFLRILDSKVFEIHRENIEKIIMNQLNKLEGLNINKEYVSLYAVNSTYKEEIQIVI